MGEDRLTPSASVGEERRPLVRVEIACGAPSEPAAATAAGDVAKTLAKAGGDEAPVRDRRTWLDQRDPSAAEDEHAGGDGWTGAERAPR